MKRIDNIHIATLRCVACNTRRDIPRRQARRRDLGHLKTMFCNVCKTQTQFREVEQ